MTSSPRGMPGRRGARAVLAAAFIALVLIGPFGSLPPGELRHAIGDPILREANPLPSPSRITSSGAVPASDDPSFFPPPLAIPTWDNVTSASAGGAPPEVFSGTMSYDAADGVTVEFGGCAPNACPENQTWIFEDGAWTNVTDPYDAPPARYAASMDYDANLGGILLFGGVSASVSALGDTWLYRGGIWENLTALGASPAPRFGASMAFDPQPEENGSVLFGGYVESTGFTNDTWVWQGWAGWVRLMPAIAPPPTGYGQMAYDQRGGFLLLFGCGLACSPSDQTWELYSGQWWAIYPQGAIPPARAEAAMVYEPSDGAVMMFGGYALGTDLNDSWIFEAGRWYALSYPVAPAPREEAEATLAGPGNALILFGGVSLSASFNDTWVFEISPNATVHPSVSRTEASVPVDWSTTVTYGSPPYRALIGIGDGTSGVAVSDGPSLNYTHGFATAGSFGASVTVVDAVGETAQARSTNVSVVDGPNIAASASPPAGDVGSPIALQGIVEGPAGASGSFHWEFGDGSAGDGANTTHAYTVAGTYTANVSFVDDLGGSATSSVAVVVRALPNVSLDVSPSAPESGVPTVFYANVTGGTSPIEYAWNFGDGSRATFVAPQHSYSKSGTYSVTVWVNDSAGGTAHESLSVTVSVGPASSAAQGGGGGTVPPPTWFWLGVAILVAAAVIGAFVLWRRAVRTK